MLTTNSVLHYWSARYGSVPIAGGKPTHSRTSAGRWIDQQGVLQNAIVNTPRMGWASVASERRQIVTLEQARTNAMLWSSDFSNAVWLKTNFTVATGVSDPTGGVGASTLTATAANAQCSQSLAAGSSLVRTNSIWIRRRTGTGAIFLYTADGTPIGKTITSNWQRFSATGSASTLRQLVFQCATSGDAIDAFIAQQDDSPVMSSEIATTSAAVTRATDAFYWDAPILGQAIMMYVRHVERGAAIDGTNAPALVSLAANAAGSNPIFRLYDGGGSGYRVFYSNGTDFRTADPPTFTPAYGDTVELVAILLATGAVGVIQSLNGAAVTSPANSTAPTGGLSATAFAALSMGGNGTGTSVGLNDFAEVKLVKYADVVASTAQGIMDELHAFELGPNGAVL